MLTNVFIVSLMGLITYFHHIYGLGLFALSLLCHGFLVSWFGSSAHHTPLYCGIAVTFILLVKGHLKIKLLPSTFVLFGLFMVMGLSALMSANYERSLSFLLLYTKGFLLSILIAFVADDERDIKILSIFLLLGVFIGSLGALFQYVTGSFTLSIGDLKRATSLRGDPNDTAMILAAGIPLAVFWMLHTKSRFVRIMNIVVFSCILGGLILTKSRGGFVTLVLVMGILYIKNLSWKTTNGGLIVIAGILIFGASSGYWDRIDTLRTGNEKGHSLEYRIDLLKKGTSLFYQNILIGVGPGQFGRNYMKLKRDNSLIVIGSTTTNGPAAHNLFLEFAVENGICGIILLLLVFFFSLRGFNRLGAGDLNNLTTGIGPYLAISLVALLISGLFLSQGKNSVLWFLVGLGIAAESIRTCSSP